MIKTKVLLYKVTKQRRLEFIDDFKTDLAGKCPVVKSPAGYRSWRDNVLREKVRFRYIYSIAQIGPFLLESIYIHKIVPSINNQNSYCPLNILN